MLSGGRKAASGNMSGALSLPASQGCGSGPGEKQETHRKCWECGVGGLGHCCHEEPGSGPAQQDILGEVG